MCIVCASCNSHGASNNIKFETLEGTIKKPVTVEEAPYDSISIEYKIEWPIEGNKNMISYLQAWIIDRISAGSGIKNAKLGIIDILDSISTRLARDWNNESLFEQNIFVTVEENSPFQSYLTITVANESFVWMAPRPIQNSESITLKLADGEIFQADKAIRNEEAMRALIGAHIEKKYKSEFPDWQWSDQITLYNRYNIPLPSKGVQLTKDGMLVVYEPGEISYAMAGGYSCVIPFDEVIPVLSEDAQAFLSDLKKTEDNKVENNTDISDKEAIEIIKKANIHEDGSLSRELKEACAKDHFGNDPFLKYGDYPDCVLVEKPDIKIFKMLPESNKKRITVVFDFIDSDSPHMGWISKQDQDNKICAMDFILENGKWVVDNFYEEWNATPESFDKNNASSFK